MCKRAGPYEQGKLLYEKGGLIIEGLASSIVSGQRRSGVSRLRPHLFRHNFAQVALEKGVERAAPQDILGHKAEAMTRRYTSGVRQKTAARLMPRFSPL